MKTVTRCCPWHGWPSTQTHFVNRTAIDVAQNWLIARTSRPCVSGWGHSPEDYYARLFTVSGTVDSKARRGAFDDRVYPVRLATEERTIVDLTQ
jgi:hypothetical protein